MNDLRQADVTRRALLRGMGALGAGAMFAGALPGRLLAAQPGPAWPNVTSLIDRYVGARKVAGMIAALGWQQAAPQYIARGREGFDDRDPGGPGSLYRCYSMTKPVTGLAAAMLIDEGKLRLDQPLADFAPEFAKMQVAIDPAKSLAAQPTDQLITIRHLLTHTSGLGYAVIGRNNVGDELKRLGVNPGLVSRRRLPGVNDGPPTPGPDEFLRRAALVPLVAQPGTKWRYSMSLDVLGIIIARAAGVSGLDVFLRERLFGPAGMNSSFFQVPGSANPRLTTNYVLLSGIPLPIDRPGSSIYDQPPPFAFGGSGLVSSPADYDRFLMLILGGGMLGGKRIVNEAAVRLATSDLLPPEADLTGTFVAGNRFGAGAVVGAGKDTGLWGWSGAAGTVGFAHTGLGLRTSLFVQYMPQEQLPILKEFPQAVGADLTAMGHNPK